MLDAMSNSAPLSWCCVAGGTPTCVSFWGNLVMGELTDMSDDPTFGAWLKRRRRELDLTQQALAEEVGCSSDMVGKVEGGQARPSRQLSELLVRRLGVPP